MTFKQAVRKAHKLFGNEAIVLHEHKWSNVCHRPLHDYWIFGDSGKSLIAHVETSFDDLFADARKRQGVSA